MTAFPSHHECPECGAFHVNDDVSAAGVFMQGNQPMIGMCSDCDGLHIAVHGAFGWQIRKPTDFELIAAEENGQLEFVRNQMKATKASRDEGQPS